MRLRPLEERGVVEARPDDGRRHLATRAGSRASIAAQVVLGRILDRERESRASLGRARALPRAEWAFVNASRVTIVRQSRRFGSSLDWGRLRFTDGRDQLEGRFGRSSQLYQDDLAYRTGPWRTGASAARPQSAISRSCRGLPNRTLAILPGDPPARVGVRSLDRYRHYPPGDPLWRCRRRRPSRRSASSRPGWGPHHVLCVPFVERVAMRLSGDPVVRRLRRFETGALKITPGRRRLRNRPRRSGSDQCFRLLSTRERRRRRGLDWPRPARADPDRPRRPGRPRRSRPRTKW